MKIYEDQLNIDNHHITKKQIIKIHLLVHKKGH